MSIGTFAHTHDKVECVIANDAFRMGEDCFSGPSKTAKKKKNI